MKVGNCDVDSDIYISGLIQYIVYRMNQSRNICRIYVATAR